jgi:hypothetical protein
MEDTSNSLSAHAGRQTSNSEPNTNYQLPTTAAHPFTGTMTTGQGAFFNTPWLVLPSSKS